jgi:hypothetical protein
MPIITLDTANSLKMNTYANSANPGGIYGTDLSFDIGVNGTRVARAYFLFDLGLIPFGSTINSAKLELVRVSSGGTSQVNYRATAVSTAWNSTTLSWNTKPSLTNVYQVTPINNFNSTMQVEVKTLVENWVSGKIINYGFEVAQDPEGAVNSPYTAHSMRTSAISYRPKLIIDYTLPSVRRDAYIVSAKHDTSSSSPTYSVVIPSQATKGDFVFVTLQNDSPNFGISAPQGWVSIYDFGVSSYRMASFYKQVGDNEPNPTFGTGSTAVWWESTAVYRNAKSVLAVQSRRITSGTQDFYPPTISTTKPNALAVSINNTATHTSTTSIPIGFANSFTNGQVNSTVQSSTSNMHDKTTLDGLDVITQFLHSSLGVSSIVLLEPMPYEPPTPPTNVKVDKTSYEVGDPISVSFTPSTDPNGDTIKYIIEQYDPARKQWLSFPQVSASVVSVTCKAMVDTTVSKLRAAAINSKGSVSAYAESPIFAVKQKAGKLTVPLEVTSGYFYNNSRVPTMRFANGWLGYITRASGGTMASVLLSKDHGKTWNFLGDITGTLTKGVAATSNGNMLYVLYHTTSTRVSVLSLDVTTLTTNATITKTPITVGDFTDTRGMSIAFDRINNRLRAVISGKTATRPGSFNLIRYDVNLNVTGDAVDATFVKNVSEYNTTGTDVTYPCIDVGTNRLEHISATWTSGSQNAVVVYQGNPMTNNWLVRLTKSTGTVAPVNASVIVSPSGTVNLSFVGYVSGVSKAMFAMSTSNGDSWDAEVDLGNAEDIAMSVDPTNYVHLIIRNSVSIFHATSNNGFLSFPPASVIATNAKTGYTFGISTFKDPSFKTKFTVPPTIVRLVRIYDSAEYNAFFGSWEVAERPVIDLTSPVDNVELIEGMDYVFTGTAQSKMTGAVIVAQVSFGSGYVPLGTFISDGSTPVAFSKTFTYKNKQIFDGNTAVSPILDEGRVYTSGTIAFDSTNTLYSDITQRMFTVKYNMAPVISGTDQDLGAFTQIPSVNYSATDPEGNTFTFTEYLNGKQIRSFAGVAGQQYTVAISHDAWIRLDLDVQHQIKIVATDSAGISSERIYTFTRKETHIEFMLEYGNSDIKADFTLDGMPLRVLVTLEKYLPEGSSIESVKVCNNYLDDVPTWEDCTGAVKGNRGYLFTNKNKTAPEWAINLWVTIDKGTAKERVLVNGYGGAFD